MEAIPQQLAAGLQSGSLRLQVPVTRVHSGWVELATGETLQAKAIVVAVEGNAASKLLGGSISGDAQSVTCLYFAAEHSPIQLPILVLNGEGKGPVNNLCVPSLVAPSYAPKDQHLISATVLGLPSVDDSQILSEVRQQLTDWFGPTVKDWRHLRTYRIPYALPRQLPPAMSPAERDVRWQPGLYVCGDHRDNASIQGAMVSGRRTAEAVLADR
jgi:phytoene dehydrogenase-like protein